MGVICAGRVCWRQQAIYHIGGKVVLRTLSTQLDQLVLQIRLGGLAFAGVGFTSIAVMMAASAPSGVQLEAQDQ